MSSSQLRQVLMESGSCSQTEGQPPALPAKQHRSRSYRGSSADSDSVLHSPAGLQHLNYTFNDVFPEAGDCNAALCPIHQGLAVDPLKHLVRFFSDGTPPPVPKKRLSRALSLPGNHGPPSSPMSPQPPLQMYPQNFDNPLYMLAPICDTRHSKESAQFGAVRSSPAPLLSLSQLAFDTPDEQLLNLFGSFDDQGAVSKGIQHCHLLFLRSMAQNIEAKLLLQKEVSEKPVSSYQPQDFLLDEGSEPKRVAGTVYYSVHSSKFPGRTLALRVCKHTNEASSAHARLQPLHVNVQTVVAHFQPITLKDSCTFPNLDSSLVSGKGCTAAKTPCGGSNEYANFLGSNLVSTVQHLLWKGHCVSIERDLPRATLEDFVQESTALQNTDCLLYDKQVCLLLLQILMGSHHLYNNSVSAPELIPREILLVWPNTERETNTKLKVNEQEDAEKKGQIQMLWRTLGSPRVVITSQTSALSLPESFVYIKTQMGALIQYCLNAHKGLALLNMSSYRKGMLYLASQLHRDSSSPHINDIVSMLQVILWGPSLPLFNPKHSVTSAVQNWLTIKRALLVMKLAEKGLIQDPSGLDWEDCLSLQYLSFTEPETVVNATSQFQLSE